MSTPALVERPPVRRERSCVRSFRSPADKTAAEVFLIHPGALPADVYAKTLLPALSPEMGVHVLDLSSVYEYFGSLSENVSVSIESIAAMFSDEIERRLNGSERPFVLVGWSFGGVIAFEIARRFEGRSEFSGLVLLDSISPAIKQKNPKGGLDRATIMRWFAMYLSARRGAPVLISKRDLRGIPEDMQLEAVLEASIAAGIFSPDTTTDGIGKLFRTFQVGLLRNNRLSLAYPAPRIDVDAVLVRADQTLIDFGYSLGWWRLFDRHLQVASSHADHYSMLTDTDTCGLIANHVTKLALRRSDKSTAGTPKQWMHRCSGYVRWLMKKKDL